jgi:contractile injection system tube protein/LysM domain-containing protein
MASAPPSGFERATLEIEGGGPPIECLFNPTEYAISKTNIWKVEPVTGAALPPPQFGGGLPRELSLELLFDTSDSDSKDVREITDKLLKATEVGDAGGGRPPTITFGWGQTVSFKAVARQLTIRYTLFRADGSPIRALAHMTLMQAEKAQDASSGTGGTSGGGNPTTRGVDAISARVVRDGDSLASIAFSAYGDPTRWRAIADANGIDDPLRLRRGSTLMIPRLES